MGVVGEISEEKLVLTIKLRVLSKRE